MRVLVLLVLSPILLVVLLTTACEVSVVGESTPASRHQRVEIGCGVERAAFDSTYGVVCYRVANTRKALSCVQVR